MPLVGENLLQASRGWSHVITNLTAPIQKSVKSVSPLTATSLGRAGDGHIVLLHMVDSSKSVASIDGTGKIHYILTLSESQTATISSDQEQNLLIGVASSCGKVFPGDVCFNVSLLKVYHF